MRAIRKTARRRAACVWVAMALGAAAGRAGTAFAASAAPSEWVFPGKDGKLQYRTTPAGDRIMDFSYAGYRGGGVALPEVPVRRTVQPSGGEDDTAAIQAAIDEVSRLPLRDGFRGAVLLAPGTFTCARTLTIAASGVVLRGSGSGREPGGATSVLKLSGTPHLAIAVRRPGAGRRGRTEPEAEDPARSGAGPRTAIADAYVPSGAVSFSVADAKGFARGDTILIERPVTAAWVQFMGMHDLTREGRPQTWLQTGTTVDMERRVAAISGNRLTLDVPLSDSFDAKYLSPPGVAVVKIPPPERLTEIGVEHLQIASPLQEISHTQPHFTALRISGQDCWARDLLIEETMNSVGVGGRRITLQQVTVRRKAPHQGSSKPAEFAPNASEVLLDRCAVVADNVWFVATGARQSGPIVVLNATFLGNGRAESHQRWSTGLLFDNNRVPDGRIELRNRGAMGSGHGWSMGWGVVWNSVASGYIVQSPPGALNWLVGSIGENRPSPRPFGSAPNLPGAIEDSPGRPVSPRSLYLTQLAERLGHEALRSIGYSSTDPTSTGDELAPPPATSTSGSHGGSADLGADLALDRPVLASSVRGGSREFGAWQALDGRDETYWAAEDGTTRARLEFDTEGALVINAVEIREALGLTGRVRAYQVEGMVDSAWRVLARGTTVGDHRLDRFPETTVWKVRLMILEAAAAPAIREFGIYREKAHAGSDTAVAPRR